MVDIIEMRYISLELNKNLYEHLSFSNNNKITFINLQCARQSPNHVYVLSHLNFKPPHVMDSVITTSRR